MTNSSDLVENNFCDRFNSYPYSFLCKRCCKRSQIKSHQVAADPNNLRRRTKSAYSMFLVYCVLLCCYLPYSMCLAVGKLTGYKKWNWIEIDFTLTIVNINSSINPLIYCYRMREIRKAMSHTLYAMILGRKKAN